MSARATQTDPSRRLRALAIAGAALAFGLMAWRGASVLTANVPAEPASQQDRHILNLIEPVTGPGNARVSVRYSGENGGRSFLVLINGAETNASPYAPRIESLLTAGAGYEPASDKLTLQQFPFAQGASAAPQPAEIAEIAALGLLTLLLCFLGLSPRREAPRQAEALPQSEGAQSPTEIMTRKPAPLKTSRAAQAAAEDPAKAAEVIRKWMAGETAA